MTIRSEARPHQSLDEVTRLLDRHRVLETLAHRQEGPKRDHDSALAVVMTSAVVLIGTGFCRTVSARLRSAPAMQTPLPRPA
jgi:hypothetical protein